MHILQVAPYYPPAYAYGGIPRIIGALSRTLAHHGNTVSVVTTDAHSKGLRSERLLYEREDDVHIYTAPNLSNRLAFQQQLYLPILTQQYFQAIQAYGAVDVVHLHGHRNLLNSMVVRWAKHQNIPYVFTANGTLRRHEQKEKLKVIWDACISRKIPFEAARCIVVSEADATIHRQWGISTQRITRIPNGIELTELASHHKPSTLRQEYNIPDSSPIISYLGRISPRKGVDKLIQAFQQLPAQSTAHLIIAGSDMGGLSTALQLGQNNPHIHFVDTISGNQRLDLLQTSDIIVYPSQREIFGLVPFEALMSGTPVIVSDDCGCGEIIQQSGSGFVTPYGDIKQLAQRISELLYTPSLGRAMVDRGQRYIQKHLSMETVTVQHIALYNEILHEQLS